MNRVGAALGSALLALLAGLSGCRNPPPAGHPHYVSGDPWQAEGVWHYPAQRFELTETGLASIYGPDSPTLTADGEVFDPTALTAAHPTLQLPAIVRLTNLENGLQVLLRVNDRGPSNPGRILAVTPRVAELLAFDPTGVARVRLEVRQAESRDAAAGVAGGGAARLDVATAPRAAVEQEALPPPPGMAGASQPQPVADTAPATDTAASSTPGVQRLAENITRTAPAPGALWLRLGIFSRAEFARMQLARITGLGARIETIRNGRSVDYRVTMGPYSEVHQADAALARVIAAGITDGRIVIE